MSSSFKSYRDLEVWQKGIQLAKAIYQLTTSFPSEERFGLSNQMRRAAVSIPSNIAEGHARLSTAEFQRFLTIAMGSVAELLSRALFWHRWWGCGGGEAAPTPPTLGRSGGAFRPSRPPQNKYSVPMHGSVETQILLSVELGFISEAIGQGILKQLDDIGKMARGLHRSLSKRKDDEGKL